MIKSLFAIKDLKNSSILPPQWPSENKIDNNKITTIMIKSLFTNSDYNKRFLKILEIYKKLRDIKTEVNTLVKKGIQSTMILKKKSTDL